MLMNKKLENKTKFKIAGASLAGVALLASSTFALFTTQARTKDPLVSKVGTVEIAMEADIAHENDQNIINPGDNDKAVPAENRKGTDHEFKIAVKNTGSKSIMARHLIEITALNSKGEPIVLKKDDNSRPAVLVTKANKSTLSPGDTSISGSLRGFGEKDAPIEEGFENGAKVATIVTEPFALNGSVEKESGVIASEKTLVYDLGLANEVADELNGGSIQIRIETQAMQYRNTGEKDWKTVFKKTIVNKA